MTGGGMNRTGVGVLGLLWLSLLQACGGGDGGAVLVVAGASAPDGTTGQPYSGYTFTASGGTPPLHWIQSGALPPGMSLDSTGSLAGTPITAGTYVFAVIVTDSSTPAMSAQAPVNLRINDSPIVVSAAPSPPAGIVTY